MEQGGKVKKKPAKKTLAETLYPVAKPIVEGNDPGYEKQKSNSGVVK